MPIKRTHHAIRRTTTGWPFTRNKYDVRETQAMDTIMSKMTQRPQNVGQLLKNVPLAAPTAKKMKIDTIKGTDGISSLSTVATFFKPLARRFRVNPNTTYTVV
jgi:hypothetical protein